jgi:two-component system response regulator YesN
MQRVLIVDDNSFFRKVVRESIYSRFPSLIISEAKDRKEALEQMLTFHPDLIFMDIRLPDGNGLEVTRQIKELDPDVEVVILTNYDQVEYRDAAFRNKVDHFASKDSFMSLIGIILSHNPVS